MQGSSTMGVVVWRRIDPASGRHLRGFVGQVAFFVLASSPTLLIDHHAPVMFLSVLKSMCGLTALLLLFAGLLSTPRRPEASFWPGDHCLAFVLLQLACSIALRTLE